MTLGEGEIDASRVDSRPEAAHQALRHRLLLGREQRLERRACEIGLALIEDLARPWVRKEDMAGTIDHDHAVRGALEEARIALEELDALLRLHALERALLGLVPERLQDTRIAQGDGGGVRQRRDQRKLGVAEARLRFRAQKQHAEGSSLVLQDGHQG